MVDRGYQEDAPAEVPEADDLDDHRDRLEGEDAADEEQEEEGLRHHGEGGEPAPDRHRPGVAHDHLGGPGVVPEEADQPPDQRRAHDREVELVDRPVPGRARADERDDVHRGEREQGDDAGACR